MQLNVLRARAFTCRWGRRNNFRLLTRQWSSAGAGGVQRSSDDEQSYRAGNAARDMGRTAADAIRKVLFEKDPGLEKLNSSSQLSAGVIESMLAQFIESSRNSSSTDSGVAALDGSASSSIDARRTEIIDFETLDLLTMQSQQLIASSSDSDTALRGMRLLEDIMRFYITHSKPMAAAAILLRSQRLQETSTTQLASVAAPICGALLQQLVESCNWHYGAYVAMYMIERDLDLDFRSTHPQSSSPTGSAESVTRNTDWDSAARSSCGSSSGSRAVIRDTWLFHTVGGLMAHPVGVNLSLRLMQQIAKKRRSDLSRMFSFQKAALLSRSLNTSLSLNFNTQEALHAEYEYRRQFDSDGKSGQFVRLKQLPSKALEDLAAELLTQYRHHKWFSHSLAKMLVSISLAGNQQEVASRFVSQCLQIAADDAVRLNASNNSASEEDGINRAVEQSNELLAMLRTFSQADGIVQTHSFFPEVSAQKCSAVTFVLLQSFWCSREPLVEHIQLPSTVQQQQLQQPGLLTVMALMNSYWVLAYRVRDVHIDLPIEAEGVSTEEIHLMDAPLRRFYRDLMAFSNDNRKMSGLFSPSAGYERRAFRIMCDDLGLEHKIVTRSPDGSLNDGAWGGNGEVMVQVQKMKTSTLRVAPAPLEELLHHDMQLNSATNSRKYDALPIFWSRVQNYLRRMDEEQLSLIAHRQLNAMRNYPMISWALLWMQELKDRNIPLQHGTLRSALKMCDKRNDIYGLLEILHVAERENLQRQTGEQREYYNSLLHQFNERPHYSSSVQLFRKIKTHDARTGTKPGDIDGWMMEGSRLFDALASVTASTLYGDLSATDSSNFGGDGSSRSSMTDQLSNHDWNKACLLAFRGGKHTNLPMHSYREAFTEVMVLMRRCGVDLENNSLQTIMRFLVYSKHNPDLLSKLAKRMYLDRSVFLTHIECIALSTIVLQQIRGSNRCLSLSKPAYQSKNYLVVFPDTQERLSSLVIGSISVLGTKFLRCFEASWSQQCTKNGRNELYILLKDLLHPADASYTGHSRDLLVRGSEVNTREAIALVCVYAAYLVGANDGAYRRSFELLYLAHTMLEEGSEADAAARNYRNHSDAEFADEYELTLREEEDEALRTT